MRRSATGTLALAGSVVGVDEGRGEVFVAHHLLQGSHRHAHSGHACSELCLRSWNRVSGFRLGFPSLPITSSNAPTLLASPRPSASAIGCGPWAGRYADDRRPGCRQPDSATVGSDAQVLAPADRVIGMELVRSASTSVGPNWPRTKLSRTVYARPSSRCPASACQNFARRSPRRRRSEPNTAQLHDADIVLRGRARNKASISGSGVSSEEADACRGAACPPYADGIVRRPPALLGEGEDAVQQPDAVPTVLCALPSRRFAAMKRSTTDRLDPVEPGIAKERSEMRPHDPARARP